MKSQNIHYIPALDHLRALAAILVIFFHGVINISHRIIHGRPFDDTSWPTVSNPLSSLLTEGHTGVTLFFVLSGFLFTTATLDRDIRYIGFLKNRFLRTYPLFLLFLLAGALFYSENLSVLGVLKSVFFMANLPSAFSAGPFTFVAWSIAIEWQFYLVFPLLIFLLKRYGVLTLPVLLLTAIAIRILMFGDGIDMRLYSYWTMVGRADHFLLGMMAGYFYHRHFQASYAMDVMAIWSAALLFGLLFGFNHLGGGHLNGIIWIFWPTVEGITWALFMLCYLSAARHIPALINQLLVGLGTISYSLYMVHYLVIYFLMERNWDAIIVLSDPLARAAINTLILVMPPVLIISTLTYFGIERPFLRLRGIYLSRDQARSPAASVITD